MKNKYFLSFENNAITLNQLYSDIYIYNTITNRSFLTCLTLEWNKNK